MLINAKHLEINHYMKKYSKGKSGHWIKLYFKNYDLTDDGDVKITYDEELGAYFLKSNRIVYLSGRSTYNGILFCHDRLIVDQEIFQFSSDDSQDKQGVINLPNEFVLSLLPIVLIGETGTGKGTVAAQVHQLHSPKGPWVHINIASLSPGLVESELFGHTKGAFTGSIQTYQGAIKAAHQGVLFLDEIDSLSIELQGKLLLFLDDYSFRPVGSNKVEKVRIKLVVASGKSLEELVSQGKMRSDFYYRIMSGHVMKLDSLRNKPDLIRKYCIHFCEQNKLTMENLLIEYYMTLPWYGNFRQLKFHMEKKLSLKKGVKHLHFEDCDRDLQLIGKNISYRDIFAKAELSHCSLREMQKIYTQTILQHCLGNPNEASKHLGISKRTMQRLLQDFN